MIGLFYICLINQTNMKINSIQDYFAFIARDEQFDPAGPNYLGFINIDPSVGIHQRWIGEIIDRKDDSDFLEMVNQYGLKLTRVTPTELIVSESDTAKMYDPIDTAAFSKNLFARLPKRPGIVLNITGVTRSKIEDAVDMFEVPVNVSYFSNKMRATINGTTYDFTPIEDDCVQIEMN